MMTTTTTTMTTTTSTTVSTTTTMAMTTSTLMTDGDDIDDHDGSIDDHDGDSDVEDKNNNRTVAATGPAAAAAAATAAAAPAPTAAATAAATAAPTAAAVATPIATTNVVEFLLLLLLLLCMYVFFFRAFVPFGFRSRSARSRWTIDVYMPDTVPLGWYWCSLWLKLNTGLAGRRGPVLCRFLGGNPSEHTRTLSWRLSYHARGLMTYNTTTRYKGKCNVATVASVFRSVLQQVPPGDQAADLLPRRLLQTLLLTADEHLCCNSSGSKTCWETPDTLAVARWLDLFRLPRKYAAWLRHNRIACCREA